MPKKTSGRMVGHSERAPINAELGTPSRYRNCDGGRKRLAAGWAVLYAFPVTNPRIDLK
jgi:hypothetical protein